MAGGKRFKAAILGALASLVVITASPAAAENRTLDLYNTHTRERLTITFKKDGRFIPSALKQLNHFLRDWRRNEPTNMDPRLFDTVWEIYGKSGSRQPIHVVCGYRALATNNMLRSRSKGVAKHSQHTLGKAMDFYIPDVNVNKIRSIGVQMQRGGVGWYPSANSPFVHIDVGSVRAWPRMTRSQLVSLFPDGKTVHLPSDGKPLAGYQQALAELKKNGGSSRPLAMAEADSTRKKSGGLLAMLFGDEEDEAEEIGASMKTTGQSVSAAGDEEAPAKVSTKAIAPPPAEAKAPKPAAAPAPQAPVVAEPAPAAPAAPQTLPFAVASAEAPAVPPPVPQKKPAELLALAEMQTAMLETPVMPRAKPEMPAAAPEPAPSVVAEVRPSLPAVDAEAAVAELAASRSVLPPAAVPPSAAVALAEVAERSAKRPLATSAEDAAGVEVALAAPSTLGSDTALASDTALGYAADVSLAPLPAAPVAPKAQRKLAYASATPTAHAPHTGTGTTGLQPLAVGSKDGRADILADVPGSFAEKTDQLATLTTIFPPADLPVYDAYQSVAGRSFAILTHPDQLRDAMLFEAPVSVLQSGFGQVPMAGLASSRFTGAAVARLAMVQFPGRQDLALR